MRLTSAPIHDSEGMPISGVPLFGVEKVPLVMMMWLNSRTEVAADHVRILKNYHPHMLCGDQVCINHEHISFRKKVGDNYVTAETRGEINEDFILRQLKRGRVLEESFAGIVAGLSDRALHRLL